MMGAFTLKEPLYAGTLRTLEVTGAMVARPKGNSD